MTTPAEKAAEQILGMIYQTLLFGNTEKLLDGKDWITPLIQAAIDEALAEDEKTTLHNVEGQAGSAPPKEEA